MTCATRTMKSKSQISSGPRGLLTSS